MAESAKFGHVRPIAIDRTLKKLNRRGFVVARSEEEAKAVRQAAMEELNVKADVVNFGSPCHWFVFKPDLLDDWIEIGFLQRKDGKPIERL